MKQGSTRGRTDKNGNPIEFRLTYEQWVSIWQEAGVLPGRNYVLSRKDDTGHYEIGNVYVNHNLQNITESLTSNSIEEQLITEYAIKHGYKRRIVKGMLRRGEIDLSTGCA